METAKDKLIESLDKLIKTSKFISAEIKRLEKQKKDLDETIREIKESSPILEWGVQVRGFNDYSGWSDWNLLDNAIYDSRKGAMCKMLDYKEFLYEDTGSPCASGDVQLRLVWRVHKTEKWNTLEKLPPCEKLNYYYRVEESVRTAGKYSPWRNACKNVFPDIEPAWRNLEIIQEDIRDDQLRNGGTVLNRIARRKIGTNEWEPVSLKGCKFGTEEKWETED